MELPPSIVAGKVRTFRCTLKCGYFLKLGVRKVRERVEKVLKHPPIWNPLSRHRPLAESLASPSRMQGDPLARVEIRGVPFIGIWRQFRLGLHQIA